MNLPKQKKISHLNTAISDLLTKLSAEFKETTGIKIRVSQLDDYIVGRYTNSLSLKDIHHELVFEDDWYALLSNPEDSVTRWETCFTLDSSTKKAMACHLTKAPLFESIADLLDALPKIGWEVSQIPGTYDFTLKALYGAPTLDSLVLAYKSRQPLAFKDFQFQHQGELFMRFITFFDGEKAEVFVTCNAEGITLSLTLVQGGLNGLRYLQKELQRKSFGYESSTFLVSITILEAYLGMKAPKLFNIFSVASGIEVAMREDTVLFTLPSTDPPRELTLTEIDHVGNYHLKRNKSIVAYIKNHPDIDISTIFQLSGWVPDSPIYTYTPTNLNTVTEQKLQPTFYSLRQTSELLLCLEQEGLIKNFTPDALKLTFYFKGWAILSFQEEGSLSQDNTVLRTVTPFMYVPVKDSYSFFNQVVKYHIIKHGKVAIQKEHLWYLFNHLGKDRTSHFKELQNLFHASQNTGSTYIFGSGINVYELSVFELLGDELSLNEIILSVNSSNFMYGLRPFIVLLSILTGHKVRYAHNTCILKPLSKSLPLMVALNVLADTSPVVTKVGEFTFKVSDPTGMDWKFSVENETTLLLG